MLLISESRLEGSSSVLTPLPPRQEACRPIQLDTWKTYLLRAKQPELYPDGAIRLTAFDEGTHELSTGGWMGSLLLTTSEGSIELRISDSKLDDSGWDRLIDDLSSAVAGLPLAELVSGDGLEQTRAVPTPFVQRLVLRAYAIRASQALDAITRRPHEAIEATDEWTTPDRATSVTPGAVVEVMQRGAFTDRGPVADRLNGFAPSIWRETTKQITSDTPENRFARHVTETMLALALRFQGDTVLRELEEQARFALASAPLRSAGPYQRFPSASRVLREHHGYRELREIYFALMGSAKVKWHGLEEAIRGGLRNTEVLYQYWCFLALQRRLGVKIPSLPTRRTASGMHIELSVGVAASVETPSGLLWYERQFVPPTGTYAVPLRPDFSLARPDGRWDLFDAKFRLDIASDAKHEDIVKMHAYRDAIRGCHAAWVLYPGPWSEVHAVDQGQPPDDPSGVGVVSMKP